MPLGPKMAKPQGCNAYTGLYRESMKKSSSETTRPRALTLLSGPLPSLFKLCPWGQKWPCPRDHMFNTGL